MTIVYMIFGLLLAFQLKHFLADYPFQTPYMLDKFKEQEWIAPLASHATIHALLTFMIVFAFIPLFSHLAFLFALFDFVIHFSMDRIKASPKLLGRFGIKDKRFWWSLGFDQMVHHLTHYAIIFGVIMVLI